MRIAIVGGTGFIGSALTRGCLQQGHEVTILSRNSKNSVTDSALKSLRWPLEDKLDVDVVFNLAGETINQRWSTAARRRIVESRIQTTKGLVHLLKNRKVTAGKVINCSAVGYYGHSEEQTFTEDDLPVRTSSDFLGQVTDAWEQAADEVTSIGIPLVKARLGVVLGTTGGAFPKMVLPFRYFAGGPLGNAMQWVSWIHLEDVIRLFIFCMKEDIDGVVNFTAPNPCRMQELGKSIGKSLHRPYWLPTPSFALRLILGEMSDLLLKGQKVVPDKVSRRGFTFQYSSIDEAISQLLK